MYMYRVIERYFLFLHVDLMERRKIKLNMRNPNDYEM